ncbi:MAG: HAD-IC family P-type ATPase [Candidatus Paceibacterota bacterium]
MAKPFYKLSAQKVLNKLGANPRKGLTSDEVEKRREKHGSNELPKKKAFSVFKIIIDQIKSPMIYILIVAGGIVLFFQDYTDAIVIFGAVFLNTIVGYIQERKASKALARLQDVIKIKADVLRDGQKKVVDQKELVPGDIVTVESGDKVPADGRIIEAEELRVNESALTGEWLAAEKQEQSLDEDTPVPDRTDMLFMGTMVESGSAKMVVTQTGIKTEVGQIASMVRETEENKTPLQQRLVRFSRKVSYFIGVMALFIFLGGVIKSHEVLRMFETAVAVAVAAIPEGLPVAMTVILALGMQRILDRKGLVRKLAATETLGSTSVACTDKTLTLTEGKMVPAETFTAGHSIKGENWAELFEKEKNKDQELAVTIASLCNEGFVENPEQTKEKWNVRGKPTDRAMVKLGNEVGLEKPRLEGDYPEVDLLSFNSERKYVASLRESDQDQKLFVSGAPEKLLSLADQVQVEGEVKELNESRKQLFKNKLEELTQQGLRVISVGFKNVEGKEEVKPEMVDGITLVGFIALKDPLRKEAKKAINTCREAGMRPVVVTGDHLLTAKAVGEKLDLRTGDNNILTGEELEKMSTEELHEKIKNIDIYARVEPRHKLKIVEAWQERNEVVAMTGDGVNDSPALKKADIGVALGSGTDVAKEVSELVLLNDNFNIMVAAVEEGRAILDNLRKVITYLLSDSFSETIIIGASILLGFPLPIAAVQILWINLVEDSLPSIALAFEPKEEGIMERDPLPKNIPLLTKEMKSIIFIIGIFTDLLLLGLFYWLLRNFGIGHLTYIQTMIFTSLGIDSLFYVFSCKTLHRNIWNENIFNNKFLLWGWFFALITLIMPIYIPVLQDMLGTVPLGIADWAIIFGFGITKLGLIEVAKYYFIANQEVDEV